MKKPLKAHLIIGFILMLSACIDDKVMSIETIANNICECLEEPETVSPEKYKECYQHSLAEGVQTPIDEDSLNTINTLIIKELGTSCLSAIQGNTGTSDNADIRMVEKDRVSLLDPVECYKMTSQKGLFYVETTGDTTYVSFQDDQYLETFPDGTYSKLDFEWTEGCTFELTFVESNHTRKKDYSQPGDKYLHKVIEHRKEEKLYILHIYPRDLIFELILHY